MLNASTIEATRVGLAREIGPGSFGEVGPLYKLLYAEFCNYLVLRYINVRAKNTVSTRFAFASIVLYRKCFTFYIIQIAECCLRLCRLFPCQLANYFSLKSCFETFLQSIITPYKLGLLQHYCRRIS